MIIYTNKIKYVLANELWSAKISDMVDYKLTSRFLTSPRIGQIWIQFRDVIS